MLQLSRLSMLLLVLLTAIALAAGCGDDGDDDQASQETTNAEQTSAKDVLVGEVEGTDAYIALISDGDELRGGYVCDGKKTSVWLKPAKLSGTGGTPLESRAGDQLGSVEVSADEASGGVKVAGGEHAFNAVPAEGEAGLFREAKGEFGKPGYEETGWIVLVDGSVRGSTNFIDPTTGFIVSKSAPRKVSGTQLTTGFIDPTTQF